MRKFAITLSAMFVFGVSGAYAQEYIFPVLPVGCYVQPQPTATCPQQKTCPSSCDKTSAINVCDEIQQWKNDYFAKRCTLYTQLGLSQEQRAKAKAIDEKFFDEVAPLKVCCKAERAKYKELKRNKCKWADRHEQKSKVNDIKDEIKDKKKQHIKCFEEILTDCQKKAYKKHKKDELKCDC